MPAPPADNEEGSRGELSRLTWNSDLPSLVQRLAEREAGAEVAPAPARIPGLHAGQYVVTDDFDAPLPDSFWLGSESVEAEGQAP